MKKISLKKELLIVLLVLCMFNLTVVDSAVAASAQEPMNLITAIEIRDNKVIPAEEILNAIKTKVGQKINNEQLQKDLQAVYDLGYFFDLRIDVESYLGGVKLVFTVLEHPRISDLEIIGTKIVSADVLREMMDLKPGELLNTNTLDKDLRTLEEYYRNRGLVLAYVADVNLNGDVLQVTINEGFLNDILISGNAKTKEHVIRRELDIMPGEVFDLNKVQKNLRNVYHLGLFEAINQRIELADNDFAEKSNKVNLVIEVEEKKTGKLQLGGGYSNHDGLFGYVDVSEQNLFGRAQKLGFKWEFGKVSNYELNFFDPWAFGREFSFGASLYNTTSKNGKDKDKGNYIKKSKGATIQLGKPFAENISGSLKFKYDHTLTDWEDINYVNEEGDTRSLTFTTIRDTTDDPFSPGNGAKDIGSIEYAGQILGGGYDFTKFNLEMRRYFPGFKESQTWAFRLKTGFGIGELPHHEEFKLGGGETLRGFDYGAFSGDRMVLFNAEYRFPLVKNLEGAVFTDLGNSWKKDQELDVKDLNMSIGAGVRMNTPLGQIRLDYAFGSNGNHQPHFSIGQTF